MGDGNKMKTLENIIEFIENGFTLPKKEITTLEIGLDHEEMVCKTPDTGGYTCESGADIPFRPGFYYGSRAYYTISGKYLFSEDIKLQTEYKWKGCECSGSYKKYLSTPISISESAKPPIKKLEAIHKKIYGKIFWIPWNIKLTYVKVPNEIKAHKGKERYIVKDQMFLKLGRIKEVDIL